MIVLLSLAHIASYGQANVYTRKARLEDFQTRTTRIVLTGQEMLDAVLKEEISSRWMLSPYEFCNVQQYLADKMSELYYFVRFTFDNDFTYLTVTKGGDPDDENQLKQGFDVVMLPVAPAVMQGGDELIYLPAYIDIVQRYIYEAQLSDKVAYRGLKAICSKAVGVIHTEPAEALAAFQAGEKYGNVQIVIPSSSSRKRYELIVTTDTHELRSIRKK